MAQTKEQEGLYDKFTVTRKDGRLVTGQTFTLLPTDAHARFAMVAYAQSVEKENPALARDLRKLVDNYSEFPYEWDGRFCSASEIDGWMCAADVAHENAERGIRENPLPVYDQSGECIVAYVKNEYEPGTPDVHYLPNGDPGYPGEPGYDYWRFLSIEEIGQIETAAK